MLGQTDGRTPHRFIDPVAHTMWAEAPIRTLAAPVLPLLHALRHAQTKGLISKDWKPVGISLHFYDSLNSETPKWKVDTSVAFGFFKNQFKFKKVRRHCSIRSTAL